MDIPFSSFGSSLDDRESESRRNDDGVATSDEVGSILSRILRSQAGVTVHPGPTVGGTNDDRLPLCVGPRHLLM
jgi:ribosomal protein L27